jgi:hypothetical protein
MKGVQGYFQIRTSFLAVRALCGVNLTLYFIDSDKTISILAKHIQHELIPAQDEDGDTDISVASLSILPLKVVEAAIKSIMVRNNYGLDRIPGSGKVPAALCVWRWEVRENYVDWLPKNSREKAEVRMAERLQVSHLLN